MAITSSFLYCKAKELMLGKSPIFAAETPLLTMSSSIFIALILESHTPDQQASTSTCLRAVFTARVNNTGEHGTWGSWSNDKLLSANKISSVAGVTFFDAGDCGTPSVSAGQTVGGILIYRRITDDSDSIPIALIDIGNWVLSNGASINVNWDNGVNRIFALT